MATLLVKTIGNRLITVDIQQGWTVKEIAEAVGKGLDGTFKLYFRVIDHGFSPIISHLNAMPAYMGHHMTLGNPCCAC